MDKNIYDKHFIATLKKELDYRCAHCFSLQPMVVYKKQKTSFLLKSIICITWYFENYFIIIACIYKFYLFIS
ncbi:Uncharacterised protein [Legionella sainthelensi]|nr:Uncharacterised protein [Legionella sainthelensi]